MADLSIAGPVGLQIQPPNAMGTLGNIMNIARGAVELKRSSATLGADIERAKAESAQAQTVSESNAKLLAEANGIRGLMANGGKEYMDEQGNFDFNKLGPDVMKVAPTLGPNYLTSAYQSVQQHTAAKNALLTLDTNQLSATANFLGGLIGKEPGDMTSSLDGYQKIVPATAPGMAILKSQLATAKTKDDAAEIVRRAQLAVNDLAGQKAALTPTYQGTGAVQVQTNPVIPQVPGAVPATSATPMLPQGQTPPAQQQTMATDALGRPFIQKKDAAGNLSAEPPPGSNYKPLLQLPTGETPQTAAPLLQLRDQAQAAASAVPTQHFNNQQILSLAHDAFTGSGSAELARILGSVGLQNVGPGADAAAKTAQLIHFSKQQAVNNAVAQGANTDAARALVEQAVLPGFSPEQALKAITKVNDGLATGVDMFNKGIQATLRNPANTKDVFAIRDFQNAWTANMDPRIFMLENAAKAGDKAEIARIKTQLGPTGMKQLLVKAQTLKKLITEGAVNGP